MNLDLNNLLEGWPHEPGQIRVRKVVGSDHREKLQLRIDLGLIQMEMTGRPDGNLPHGCESLLEWFKQQAEETEAKGEEFVLGAEDCSDLQQEGIQYYHRYISLFQINDYAGVIRDTQRNLDMFSFVAEYSEQEEMVWSFEQFRAYVQMMNTRAKASLELDRGDFGAAIRQIERGRDKIMALLQDRPEPTETCSEIEFLNEWMEELQSKRPLTKLEVMEQELERAIASEAYEKAATVRDAIKAWQQSPAPAPTPEASSADLS